MAAGKKTGGRVKGTPNKATSGIVEEIKKTGETPLQYFTRVYQDRQVDNSRRDDMAKAAAPYVHAKLQSTTIAGDPDGAPIQVETSMDLNDLARRTAFLLTQAARAKKKG